MTASSELRETIAARYAVAGAAVKWNARMTDAGTSFDPSGGELAGHILSFTRTLRAAGLPVGPGHALDAVTAACCAGVTRREDFHAALCAALVRSPAQRALFDQAFHIHFRNPRLLERLLAVLLPRLQLGTEEDLTPVRRRLAQAVLPEQSGLNTTREVRTELDAFLTSSDQEILRHKDFAEMSTQELAQAGALLRRSELVLEQAPTRRWRRSPGGGRIDLRGTLQRARKSGGELFTLVRKQPRKRQRPLVLICDISGSMARYSRMFLIFAHTLTQARDRVTSFVFGTRLTNITPALRHGDPDEALIKVSASVSDWASGTRIGECLRQFNFVWSRRVLAQGGVVVLLTDGLEREPTAALGLEMARLRRSCRRLVWLNPLLGYEGFEARAAGIRAMVPHVHVLRSAHAVQSLLDLGLVLNDCEMTARAMQAGRG
jgi:uncharacterized protein with von Willebrand factor type A (vWA) domain